MKRLTTVLAAGLMLVSACGVVWSSGRKTLPITTVTPAAWPTEWGKGRIGPPEVPYSLGVNINFTRPRPGEMRMLAAAGFRWVRMDFDWSKTERVKGHYEFHAYDRLLAALERHHMRALWILDYGNALYIPDNIGYPLTPPTTRKQRRAFCRWVAAAMRHFRGHGIIWEMWNEPNGEYFPVSNRLAAKHWDTVRIDPAHAYTGFWGGAGDGIIHWPITSIAFGINAGKNTTGSIGFADAAINPRPNAGRNTPGWRKRRLFTGPHHWVFSNGAEFPGAKGSFRLVKNGATASGVLSFNFVGGGNYVAAVTSVSMDKFGTLQFKVRPGGDWDNMFLVRITDRSGQTFQFIQSRPHYCAYTKLALAVGQTIRHVAPQELYVGPALATAGTPASLYFLRRCFQGGVLTYFDGVTVHPYRQGRPETVIPVYRQLRALIATYAPHEENIPIISGEWGYGSAWYSDGLAQQARYAAREMLTNLYQRVPLSIWFDWADWGSDPHSDAGTLGLVFSTYHPGAKWAYTPKPAYWAIKTLITQLYGCHPVRRLPVGGPQVYALLFSGPAGLRVALWRMGPKSQTVMLQLKPGTYRLTNETGTRVRKFVIPPGQVHFHLTVTHDPEYVAQQLANGSDAPGGSHAKSWTVPGIGIRRR